MQTLKVKGPQMKNNINVLPDAYTIQQRVQYQYYDDVENEYTCTMPLCG